MSESERNKKGSKKPISLCIYHGRVPWLPVENGLKLQGGVRISSPTEVVCAFHKRELHQQGPVLRRGQGQVMPVLEGHNEDLVFVPKGYCMWSGEVWKVRTLKSSLWQQCGKHREEARRGLGRSLDSYNVLGETTVAWPPVVCRQKKGFERESGDKCTELMGWMWQKRWEHWGQALDIRITSLEEIGTITNTGDKRRIRFKGNVIGSVWDISDYGTSGDLPGYVSERCSKLWVITQNQ